MKLHYIAAATLLIGTSALAWPSADQTDFVDKEPIAWSAADPEWVPGAGVKDAVMEAGWADEQPKPILASGESWDTEDWQDEEAGADPLAESDPDLDLAEYPQPEDALTEQPPLHAADEPMAEAVQIALADLTPRPATQNYPPCDPGPGDDSCIQLYEPGVRTALASWNQPTGGLMGESAVAMGGPEEPIEGHHAALEVENETVTPSADPRELDGVGDEVALGASPDAAQDVVASEDHAGMGGPIAETGYPPCSGSPDDDRCIQLYERGVTGEGN